MTAILFTGNLLLLAVRSDPDAGWTLASMVISHTPHRISAGEYLMDSFYAERDTATKEVESPAIA